MMLFQVGLSSLLIIPRIVTYSYYVWNPPTTYEKQLTYTLMSIITIILLYSNFAKSFYVYTLTSQLFRSIFLQRICCWPTKTAKVNHDVTLPMQTYHHA